MFSTYTYPHYPYVRPSELGAATVRRVPLVVVGAGPVGLAAAIDAAQHGLSVLLLDEDNSVSVGSRGLCWAKRSLEILDRLGAGQAVVDRGVTWNIGRSFHGKREVFHFNLLPEAGHQRPGMVNLQQYHLEHMLVQRAQALPNLELRWGQQVTEVETTDEAVRLSVQTPDGPYTLQADWLIAADGAKSPIRRQLALDMEGQVFQDRFLIADVVLDGELFPAGQAERWFWFDPPFHPGQSVLLHREADNVWRIDFQLGWQADPEAEKQPERVAPRIRAMLDHQGFAHIGFELEWVSVYTFQCRRMKRFRHRRVLFVGDAAHQVSPFGARGANSGLQDTDNLVWKLARVIRGQAPEALLDSYCHERAEAADENLLNSTRSTDFITPKSHASQVLRNAVLSLAAQVPMGRALVNSGRLSVPTAYAASPLSTPDVDDFDTACPPGAPLPDAPVDGGWLLQRLGGDFSLLVFSQSTPDQAAQQAVQDACAGTGIQPLWVLPAGSAPLGHEPCCIDTQGLVAQRLDARPGTACLVRPDQHLAARWRSLQPLALRAALARATAQTGATA